MIKNIINGGNPARDKNKNNIIDLNFENFHKYNKRIDKEGCVCDLNTWFTNKKFIWINVKTYKII